MIVLFLRKPHGAKSFGVTNSRRAIEDISAFVYYKKHYFVHKWPPLYHVLEHNTPVHNAHIITFHAFWTHFNMLQSMSKIQGVPLATEPGISWIILKQTKILQRNMNRSTFVVWEMKMNVSVVCVCSASNCCDTEQQSASQPGSVASGTPYITVFFTDVARILQPLQFNLIL